MLTVALVLESNKTENPSGLDISSPAVADRGSVMKTRNIQTTKFRNVCISKAS
jgi:hypothetical protein